MNYSYQEFCSMMSEPSRMDPHIRALKKAVKKGSVVVEIGAGTGIISLLACRFGARKVYAIEVNPLLELGKSVALAHGYQDRIEFLQKMSTDVELPEKADVLICDLRGSTPFGSASIRSIIDARDRLLKPKGVMIARKDVMYYAPVRSRKAYDRDISRYTGDFYGFDFSSSNRLLTNQVLFGNYQDVVQLAEPQVFVEIDYHKVKETKFTSVMKWTIDKTSTVHGLQGWFEIDLGFGEKITTGPSNPGNPWGCQFLPFAEPVKAKKGSRIEVEVSVAESGGSWQWTWSTRVFEKNDRSPSRSFAQSTEMGRHTPVAAGLKQSEYFVPRRNENAEINKFFLESVDGEMLLGDIADLLLERFPAKFKDFDEAMTTAASFSVHYSE